jgi:hypothetical protein
LKFSLRHASLQAPPWRGSLRQVDLFSAAAATTYHSIRGITLVGVDGGGGWGQGPYNRRWRSFDVDDLLLVLLIFYFIGVTENDDLTVIERP